MQRHYATDVLLGVSILFVAIVLAYFTRLNALILILAGSFAAGYTIGRSGSRLLSGGIPCIVLLVLNLILRHSRLAEGVVVHDSGAEFGRDIVGAMMMSAMAFLLGVAGRWARRNVTRHDGNA